MMNIIDYALRFVAVENDGVLIYFYVNAAQMPAKSKAKKTGGRSISVRDVPANDFIRTYSRHLQKAGNVELPQWVDIVKTSHARELAPTDPNWFYTRIGKILCLYVY